MEGLLYLIAGILLGAGIMFLLLRSRYKVSTITENEINNLKDQLNLIRQESSDKQKTILNLTMEVGGKFSKEEVEQKCSKGSL
jgi:uncharacterized membrane-anchored protein YhcB (DUF1043 family)